MNSINTFFRRAFLLLAVGCLAFLASCNRPYDTVFSTYPNGAKKLVFTVVDGKAGQLTRLGEKQYYEDGTLMYEKHFSDDKPSGVWSFYYPNGNLHARGNFGKGDSLGHDWVFYKDNGEAFYDQPYDSMAVIELTADRRPLSVIYYNGNVEMWFRFNDNYTINMVGKTVGGLKEGRWEFYYANGQKMLEANYSGGVENGLYNSYRETGIPFFRGFYINGKRANVWEFYDESGNLAGRQDFDAH